MAKKKPSPRDWKEARRLQALTLKQKGWKQTEIAEALGVTKGAVSQWMTLAQEAGEEVLLARPRPGAPPKLGAEQKRLIPEYLSHGAEAYGFRGDLWTCARGAKVIEWELAVSDDQSPVSRLLKALAWTPQPPIGRAAQRDEAAIAQWRSEVWPERKKKPNWSSARWC